MASKSKTDNKPAEGETPAAEAKPAGKAAKVKQPLRQAANQWGMALALLATMVLNIPIFQHATTHDIKPMIIFEVVLMFICTGSVGILGYSATRNLGRGIIEELRKSPAPESGD